MELQQAVILCGGLGMRLRPITNSIPKPMVPVNGKPFLEYLIGQLKENGIKRILLLTGYKKEAIETYFGDGSALGVSISYSRGETEWETGKRLYQARGLIDDYFFLLYSDNFVQYNLERLKKFYITKKAPVCFVVFAKKEKNNIKLGEDGCVLSYDTTRTAQGLEFVELGCMIIDKSIFSHFDDTNFSFSKILKQLADDRKLYGFVLKDQYYSISDPQRLAMTAEYFKDKKIIILDRDGVINRKALPGEYICSWDDFEFLPGVINSLKMLTERDYTFIIISNQAGIALKKITVDALGAIHTKMVEVFRQNGIMIHHIYICPHHWDEGCECRKPNPGMLLQASTDFNIRLDKTYFFGDDERDVLAAYNANARSILIGSTYDAKRLEEYPCRPEYYAPTMADAAQYVLAQEETE